MKARRNPYGKPVPDDITLVRVGRRGTQTHVYDPEKVILRGGVVVRRGAPLCGSGYKNNSDPELYESDAQFLTCTRCIKLMMMNETRGGKPRG